jgi:hypothetical protein
VHAEGGCFAREKWTNQISPVPAVLTVDHRYLTALICFDRPIDEKKYSGYRGKVYKCSKFQRTNVHQTEVGFVAWSHR